MKPVHIFYNAREWKDADGGKWGGYQGHDTHRLAMFAAESWARQGWEPRFYNTRETRGFGEFKRLRNDYPKEFYNVWFEMELRAPGWFSTIDVFNFGFGPGSADMLEKMAPPYQCINAQESTFATACIWVTPEFCRKAIDLVANYDAGELELPPIELVSDEHVLRHHAKYWTPAGIMSFAYAQTGWQSFPLVHGARSCLQWFKP